MRPWIALIILCQAAIIWTGLWAGAVLLLPACAIRNPVAIERPNARTPLEEKSYNLLKVADTLIVTARNCKTSPTCEVSEIMRPIINDLVDGYNMARPVSDEYVGFLDQGGRNLDPALALRLEELIFGLEEVISNVIAGGGGQ